MANYLYNKYTVQYGQWSGEVYSYDTTSWYAGDGISGYNTQPSWNGNEYTVPSGSWGYYGKGSSVWGFSNNYTYASRYYMYPTGYINGASWQYAREEWRRTRSASAGTLVQSDIVGTINQYPNGGVYYADGYYYIRTGIENKPQITSPYGGEIIDSLFTITWTDNKPKSDIRYQIQLSTNNVTWKDILALTGYGATSFTYDFKNEVETNSARLRIRAYDGQNYGEWILSPLVFSISHNQAPLTPSNLSPWNIVVDKNKPIRFSWKHNDSDAQSKAVLELRYTSKGAWQRFEVNGSNQYYDLSNITLGTGTYEWRVKTYDTYNLESPYSSTASFITATAPSPPTIVLPDDNVVQVARPIVSWAKPLRQMSYQLLVLKDNQTIWDTGEVYGDANTVQIGVDLLDGNAYQFKLRYKDGTGLFSEYITLYIGVEYTVPAEPNITTNIGNAFIELVIENPQPQGTQPIVVATEIEKEVDGTWVRIAKNVNLNFIDYAVASEENIKYRIRTTGDNGTLTYSYVNVVAPKLSAVYLHDVIDPTNTIHHFKYDGKDGKTEEFVREHAFRQFVGRKKPVVEYGNYTDYRREVTLSLVDDKMGRERLIQFMNNGSIIMYRDNRGRKFYTTVPELAFTDLWYGNDITISFTEIDYSEVV